VIRVSLVCCNRKCAAYTEETFIDLADEKTLEMCRFHCQYCEHDFEQVTWVESEKPTPFEKNVQLLLNDPDFKRMFYRVSEKGVNADEVWEAFFRLDAMEAGEGGVGGE